MIITFSSSCHDLPLVEVAKVFDIAGFVQNLQDAGSSSGTKAFSPEDKDGRQIIGPKIPNNLLGIFGPIILEEAPMSGNQKRFISYYAY